GHHSRPAFGYIRPAPAHQGSADANTNAGFRHSAVLARTLSSRSASSLVSTGVRRTISGKENPIASIYPVPHTGGPARRRCRLLPGRDETDTLTRLHDDGR